MNLFITLLFILDLFNAQATGQSRRNPKKRSYRSVSYNSATYQIWFRLPISNPNP